MKKYILIAIVILALGSFGHALAETGSGSTGTKGGSGTSGSGKAEVKVKADTNTRIEKDELKAKLDAAKTLIKTKSEEVKKADATVKAEDKVQDKIKAEAKAKKEQLKEQIKAVKKEVLSKRKQFVIDHFTKAITLIESHQARVKALIEKQEAKGKTIGDAKANLQVSVDALVKAKADLEKLKTISADKETQAAALKTQSQVVEKDIKAAKDALIKTIKLLVPKNETHTEDADDEDENETEVEVEHTTTVQTQ